MHMLYSFSAKGLCCGSQGGARGDHVIYDHDTSHVATNTRTESWSTQSNQSVLPRLRLTIHTFQKALAWKM